MFGAHLDQLQLYVHPLLPHPASQPNRHRWEPTGLLYEPVNLWAPYTRYHYPPNGQPHLQMQRAPHTMEAAIHIPRVRELEFRLARHDILAASMSMLSFVMEPGEGEHEEDRQEEDQENENQGYADEDSAGGYEREYEYHQEQEVGDDREQRAGERECWDDGNDEGSAMGTEDRGGIGPRRRQKARKPRRPYTVTMALRKTNWFESSMEWEDEHFRVVYR
jgi:hypothetical protein